MAVRMNLEPHYHSGGLYVDSVEQHSHGVDTIICKSTDSKLTHKFIKNCQEGRPNMSYFKFPKGLDPEVIYQPDVKIRHFVILYDNGRTYEVRRPFDTNADTVRATGSLEYSRNHVGIMRKADYSVDMSDVAAIKIIFMDGGIQLRKFKDCAKFDVEISKK